VRQLPPVLQRPSRLGVPRRGISHAIVTVAPHPLERTQSHLQLLTLRKLLPAALGRCDLEQLGRQDWTFAQLPRLSGAAPPALGIVSMNGIVSTKACNPLAALLMLRSTPVTLKPKLLLIGAVGLLCSSPRHQPSTAGAADGRTRGRRSFWA